ncbi:MAG: serine hydrolase domain-containing protein [Acidimicrobiales bacterium]
MRDFDQILQAGIERGAAAGVSAVVVNREGTIWQGAAGERSLGGGDPMTTDTVGAIFSMTKAITSTAAMQCVERGQLELDTPASKVLPELGDPHVLTGFDDDGQPVTRPAAGEVTLRQLLTHTSGYTYPMWDANLLRWYQATETPFIGTETRASLQTPLAFDPGTQWAYGIGTDWVGLLVEAASGQTLGEYFAEHVTGPLGMTSTVFEATPDIESRLAAMHLRLDDGTLNPVDRPRPQDPEFEGGGGGLRASMEDYGRFIRMFLNDGELDGARILSPDTVALMVTNNIGDLRVSKLETVMPSLSNDAELFPGDEKTWGLAFQINEVAGFTGRPAGTVMWAGLGNSYFWIDRENGIGGAYLSQILPFVDEGSIDLFYELERAVYESL